MMSDESDRKKASEALLNSIANGEYDPRLQESLRRIKEVCDDIEKHGGRIYVSRVGKLCEEKFKGPVAQSIRNKPDTLKHYIELRTAEQKLTIEKDPRTILQKILHKISDPVVHSFVILQNETIKDREEQIGRLNKGIKSILPVEIDKLLASASAGPGKLSLLAAKEAAGERASCLRLSDVARRALARLTNEDELNRCGLRLHKGHVLTNTNHKFLGKEEFSALEELLRVDKDLREEKDQ